MRRTVPIFLSLALAGCGGPLGLQNSGGLPMGSNRIADTLASGAGTRSCIGSGLAWNTKTAADGTMAFRSGRDVYVSTFAGGCHHAGRSGYVVVTENGGRGMCEGDVVGFASKTTGMVVSTCVLGPFVSDNALRRWR